MASPAPLECAGVHVVYQNALVEETVGYVNLVRILVEIKGADSRRENVGLLIILLHLLGRNFGPAMPEVPQKLAVAIELDDAIARHGA